jgi:hypothetical protein
MEPAVKGHWHFLAVLIGTGAVLATPTLAADLSPAIVAAIDGPSCDDAVGLAAVITQVLTANPGRGGDVAAAATRRCPEDAAVIATVAVNADPNAATDIVQAVLAALPDEDKNNDVLTSALWQLGYQPAQPPGPGHYPGPVLVAPWTDPTHGPDQSGHSFGRNNPPPSSPI